MTVLQREGVRSPEHVPAANKHDADAGDASDRAAKCADERAETNPIGPATDDAPHVEQATPNPRAKLVAALGDAIKGAALAGDVEAVRIASDALTRLLGAAARGAGELVDLRTARERR